MKAYIPKLIGRIINFISLFSSKTAARLAMALFSKPFKGKLKPEERHYLETATQTQIAINNTKISTYHWEGSGTTVLLVHGWESNSYRWKELIQHLQLKNYNIVALDAPAHGATNGHEFNAIYYAKCIDKVAKHYHPEIIIGHSVGGMASVFALKNYNMACVKKMVLLGAPDRFIDLLNTYQTMLGYSQKTKTAIRAFILQKFKYLPEHFSTASFSTNIAVPCLVIHDKKDRIIPFKDGISIHKALKNSKFISTKGYGHRLKADEVYAHILNFINV